MYLYALGLGVPGHAGTGAVEFAVGARPDLGTVPGEQGWKFMSCGHCRDFGQQASWLLIGCKRVNKQSEARLAS